MRDVLLSTRRQFLKGGLTMLSAAPTMPVFLSRLAGAMAQEPIDRDGRVLVVIQLAGGNDGLNTVIPIGDDAYYRLRPRIAEARPMPRAATTARTLDARGTLCAIECSFS